MPGNGIGRYKVVCSDAIKQAVRQLHRLARQQGRADAVLRALNEISARLERDPVEAGEPTFPLVALQLKLRTVVVRPVAVEFAIHDAQPVVFVKSVVLLGKGTS